MKTRTLYSLIILSLIAILSIAGYYFAATYVGGLGEKTHQMSMDLSYVEAKYQQEISRRAVANTGENTGRKLDKYILSANGEVEVIKELERLARGLSITMVTEVLEVQQHESLSPIGREYLRIVVTTNGSEQATRRFLALIETLPYNTKMNEVNLYRKTSETGTAGWEGRFDFLIVKNRP